MTDLILFNGKIYSQDPAFPASTAVAMHAGRFVAVGSDQEVLSLATPKTRLIDLKGRLTLPGLTDSHVHFYDWALIRKQIPLEGVPSLKDLLEKVKLGVLKVKPGDWLRGQGWIETLWSDTRIPNCKDLDPVTPHNPLILWRSDLHLAVVNSLALQAAGITTETPNPPQGVIDRDENGHPTGVLRDLAINLVLDIIPPVDEVKAAEAFKEGFAVFHRLGLTGVHDQRLMGAPEAAAAFRIWQKLHTAGEIQLRVWMNMHGGSLDEAVKLGVRTGFGDDKFRTGHLKFFADGAQGARTAWMLEPYENDTWTGLPLTPIDEIAAALSKAEAAGLAVDVHAIGDRACRELITVFERQKESPGIPVTAPPKAPHRIEHLQIIRPEDIQRLSKLDIVASLQPLQVTDDISIMQPTIGERDRFAYSFRSIWDAGIPITFNSDCPVCNPNPFWSIHAAVTRRRRDGTPPGGWHPEQCMTVSEAVWGFSMGAAVVSGRQAELGSITPGKLADLVVVDRDIFSIPPMEIFETSPVLTVFDGNVVFEV